VVLKCRHCDQRHFDSLGLLGITDTRLVAIARIRHIVVPDGFSLDLPAGEGLPAEIRVVEG
jgi:hypothetical protein